MRGATASSSASSGAPRSKNAEARSKRTLATVSSTAAPSADDTNAGIRAVTDTPPFGDAPGAPCAPTDLGKQL